MERVTYRVTKKYRFRDWPLTRYLDISLAFYVSDAALAPAISGQLRTVEEIDDYVQRMKWDLDATGELAKAALLEARE